MQAFVGRDSSTSTAIIPMYVRLIVVWVSFRGTQPHSLKNWILDLKFRMPISHSRKT